MMDVLCWMDLETTGLDEKKGLILEVGMIFTDFNLNVIGPEIHMFGPLEGNSVNEIKYRLCDSFVQEMHETSGLWKALEIERFLDALPYDHAELETKLLSALVDFKETYGIDKMYPAGFSVHFDMTWLYENCYNVSKLFSHRHLDVSSIKLMQCCLSGEAPGERKDVAAHRVMDDINSALEYLCNFIQPLSEVSTLASHAEKLVAREQEG